MSGHRYLRLTILSFLILALCAGLTGRAAANGPQALFTTGPEGREVNANTFSSRLEVYINGGPGGVRSRRGRGGVKSPGGAGGMRSPGGLAPGDYVFQVTDPSGGVLLSADAAACRVFRAEDGAIVALRDVAGGGGSTGGGAAAGELVDHARGSDACHVEDAPEGAAGASGRHDTNRRLDAAGRLIQLMPFVTPPNQGHVYKVWIRPLASYLAQGGDLARAPRIEPDGFARDPGFSSPQDAKSDNFRVIEAGGEENRPPLADAGPDRSTTLGTTVILDGSGSFDADGDPITFAWTLLSVPAGSAASFSDPAAAMPELIPDRIGAYVAQLIVDDGQATSAPDTATVTIVNRPPVADAGPDQTVAAGASVNLNGSGSSDADGDPLTYAWSLDAAPAGSAASLHAADTVMPQLDTDLQGTYVVSLVVNDGTVDSAADEVSITTGNSPPVADAGADQSILLYDAAILDGSGSTDVDGDPLTYRWSVVSEPIGGQHYIDDPSAVMPFFYPFNAGSYVIQLIVNDGQVDSAPDTVTVSTRNNPPVARAGRDQSATIGMTVTLDGSTSYDVDGDPLTFAWSLLTAPAGSVATLSNAAAVMPTFDVDVDGTYVAQLIVNDGEFDSTPDTVTVTATNLAPSADAGPDQTIDVGGTVTLDGSGSSDPELFPLSYSWSLLSAPAGSVAVLSNPAAVMPTFQVDLLGDYVAQLIVSDGLLASQPDTVMISTTNVPPVADAGPDETLAAGSFIQLDGSGSSDADGDPLTYAWSFTSKPLGSVATLDDPTAAQPAFLLESVGTYVLQLIVHDGAASSSPDAVVIESLPTDRLLLLPDSDLIGLGRAVPGMVRLLSPPPPGGVIVTLSSDAPATAAIAPAMLTIPDGEDSARVSINGLALGDTIVRAAAPNYAPAAAAVTVTDYLISIEQALQLAPGQTSSLAVSLSSPAPFGGQTIFLSSADFGVATVTPSVFVPEGSQIPAANPQVTGGAIGMVDITGTTAGYAPDRSRVTVTIDIWFYPDYLLLPLETREVTLYLSAPAPAGMTLDLTIDDAAIASVPATVTPVTGATSIQVPVTGLADGQTILRAGAPGVAETTASIAVGSGIAFPGSDQGQLFVGDDLERRANICLAGPAPPTGRTIAVTSTDPGLLLLAAASNSSGAATVSVLVPGGGSCAQIWLHGLVGSGDVEITSSAPAHGDGSDIARLFPSGFVFETADFATTTLTADVPVILGVRALAPGSLDPIWTGLDTMALRAGLNVTLDPVSADVAVGTLTGVPVTFTGGETRRQIEFQPLGAGVTSLGMTTPAGFDTPASLTTIDATVSVPPIYLNGHPRVGYQLQEPLSVTLGTPPPTPVDVTVAVDDPSIVLISADQQTVGAASLVLPGSAAIYLQGLALGSATLTIQAPGYETTTASIEVVPAGFRFVSTVPASISLNTLYPDLQLRIEAEVINNQIVQLFNRGRELRPGFAVDVPVTSSDPGVVAVSGSPVAASGPFVPLQIAIDPLAAGVATVRIMQPPGFATPDGRSQTTVTVDAPGIGITPNDGSNLRVGRDLQQAWSFGLQGTPPAPVDLSVTVGSAAIATVSGDPALDGSGTIVVPGVTGSGLFYLQGRAPGTTTVTLAAPAFTPETRTVEVTPSGFEIGGNPTLTLLTFDPNRTLPISPVALTTGSLQRIGIQPLRPGVTAQVEVVSSSPTVAAVTTSPLSFSSGVLSRNTQIDPLTAGSTTITALPPAGFDMPATGAEIVATVTAPDVRMTAFGSVGLNLQTRVTISLEVAPPGPVDVTVTSLAPSIGILSDDRLVAGGSSVTFTGVNGTFVGNVYFQGIDLGGTQVVAQAAGYNDGTENFSVVPSGFVHASTLDFTTTVAAPNSVRQVRVAPLWPTTLEPMVLPTGVSQTLRGGLTATVDVTSADPGVAAAALVPVTVTGGDSGGSYAIDPIAAGSALFTVEPAPGFDTPANDRELVVMVDP